MDKDNSNNNNNLPQAKTQTPPSTYTIVDEDGHWQIIDAKTGETLRVQKSKNFQPDLPEDKRWLEVQHPDDPTKLILIDKRLPYDNIQNVKLGNRSMAFSTELAHVICDRIINGDTLKKISQDPQMPTYGVIQRWRREHPDFNEWMAEALSMRADRLADEALEIADYSSEETIQSDKLRIEQRKWQAQIDNRKYNSKITDIRETGNILINITTGVSESEYAVKAATRKLSETGEIINIKPKETKETKEET